MKTKLFYAAGIIILFTACSKKIEKVDNPAISSEVQLQTKSDFKANEVLVKFKTGINEGSREQIFSKVSGNISKRILTKAMEQLGEKEGIYVIRIPGDVTQAAKKISELPGVEYAEPNYNWKTEKPVIKDDLSYIKFLNPSKKGINDPYFVNGGLWNMYGNLSTPSSIYGSQAAEAWANGNSGSRNVYVGIIGGGVMYNHEDLKANFKNNPYDKVDGIDNDGNGYVDDIHGWDFYNGDNSVYDGDFINDALTTAVAGVIGAVGGNGKGVIGVSPLVTMLSGKFSGAAGSFTTDIIKSIDYMTDMKLRHKLKLVALNASWGSFDYSQALKDAIDRAGAAGILFITGAGPYFRNIDEGPAYYFPACFTSPNIITVGSIDSTGYVDFYSDYGAVSVDLFAPGTIIYSTTPGPRNTSSYGGYYTTLATPHVTGAVALYAAKHPNATAAEIKAAIMGSVTKTSMLKGKCVTEGMLNLSGF